MNSFTATASLPSSALSKQPANTRTAPRALRQEMVLLTASGAAGQQVAGAAAAHHATTHRPAKPVVPAASVASTSSSKHARPAAAAAATGDGGAPAPAAALSNAVATSHAAAANGNGAAAVSPAFQKVQDAATYIRSRCSLQPEVVIVLGSGLGPIADEVQEPAVIPYAEVPHFHAPAVQGHPGRLVIGRLAGVPALVLQGRFHYYEGHPMEEVILPIRVAKLLGCHTAVLTNAAGGINHGFHLGDLMLITDHLNLMTANPLRGPNPPELGGPRFLDLSEPYDRTFVRMLQQHAEALGIRSSLRTGTYAAVSGPTYETPAETRMLRAIGADAVGMSTVPEVIAARHVGVRVVGISCITNLACGISHDDDDGSDGAANKVTHEEVMTNISLGVEKLRALLVAALPAMREQHSTAAAAAAAPAGPQ